jgi:fatty-acyl-CoA synthase
VLSLGPSSIGADLSALADRQPADPMPPQGADDDPAELVYTSGSTGRPKAACYTFGRVGALSAFWADEARRDTAETAVFTAPGCRMLWAGPFIRLSAPTVMPVLLNGGTCVLVDEFEPGGLLRTIEHESITATMMTPTQLYRLLDHPDLSRADLASLRLLVLHSAPAAPTRLAQAVDRLGPILLQSYGMTETKMISALEPADHAAGRPELLRSAGRPRPGVEVEIRDGTGRALGPGETGELCVRSPLSMAGYWRQPALTAQTVVDGWVRTGDVGYRDAAGYLYLLDRLRDLVIVDGSHCYTLAVEDVLTSHQAVRRATAVGLPDERTGEAVHAAVVLRPGATVTADELRALVRDRKGETHEPRTVAFLDDIPLTPAGKPDKNAVRAELARRVQRAVTRRHPGDPQNAVRAELARRVQRSTVHGGWVT